MSGACIHFGPCGGCSHQDIPYERQLENKEAFVRSSLKGLPVQAFHPILRSPDTRFYRNKMEFSFGDQRDIEIFFKPEQPVERRVHLGLHPKKRFALALPTPNCQLMSEESQKITEITAQWATENELAVYVRKTNGGDLRHLVVREGKNTGQRMVNLVAKSATPHVDRLAEKLKSLGPTVTTFLWTPYDGLSDVARGEKHVVFWGDGVIQEKFGDLTFNVSPSSFMQTNTRAAENAIGVLKQWIGGGDHLIDLYCGSGAIGLSLAGVFKEVTGIEISRSAIEDARANASFNRTSNVNFLEGKAEDLAPSLPVSERAAGTTVVVDPPRAGLHPKMMETLLAWGIPRIFYVSCNPESLARDLKALSERYDILDVQPMDFFPHTDHIETAVRLRLKT